jgi:signal transduction histidine kinase/CheY-like chemotaxis protein
VLIINASLLLVLYLLVNQGYLLEYYGNKLDTMATLMHFIALIAVTLWSLRRYQVLVEMSQHATEQAFQAEVVLNQRKDEFLSNMSHELRTPLNGIYGVLQLIDGKDEKEASLIQSAKSATHSLTRIVNDILDTQKMAMGKLDLHLEWTHVRGAAYQMEALFTNAAKQKNIQFIASVHDDVPIEVYVDKARIDQIVSNLIGNAIKFTDNGSVSMTLSFQRQSLTIEISDTGIGMSEAFQNKMFERFTQEDSSHTKPYQGTGLGLSICKQLVELMNGTIHIKSQLEQGTSISITLPVESRGVYQCEKQAPKLMNSNPHQLSQAHILLVDDDEIGLTVAKTMLDQHCNVVRTASDAQQALALAQSGKFDVLITDIQMPEMDGVTLLKAIQDTHPDLPCIALTANASKQDVSDYYNLGFVGVVTKPFERAVLIDTLTQVMQAKETKSTRDLHLHIPNR